MLQIGCGVMAAQAARLLSKCGLLLPRLTMRTAAHPTLPVACVLIAMSGVALPAPVRAAGKDCPTALADATRLVLVVSPTMSSVSATLRRFERASPASAWMEVGKAQPAVVGKGGLGWGWTFAGYARD